MHGVIPQVDHRVRPGRRRRWVERRRLRRVDALSAQLAELHAIRTLLATAAEIVRRDWVQGAWFRVAVGGETRLVTSLHPRLSAGHSVTGACLVGAVVQAAGGPATYRSQLVQRSLDLLSHTLREGSTEPVRWCPAPGVRTIQVLELTYWNDAPGRTQREVVDLLETTMEAADLQRAMRRSEQATLAASLGDERAGATATARGV